MAVRCPGRRSPWWGRVVPGSGMAGCLVGPGRGPLQSSRPGGSAGWGSRAAPTAPRAASSRARLPASSRRSRGSTPGAIARPQPSRASRVAPAARIRDRSGTARRSTPEGLPGVPDPGRGIAMGLRPLRTAEEPWCPLPGGSGSGSGSWGYISVREGERLPDGPQGSPARDTIQMGPIRPCGKLEIGNLKEPEGAPRITLLTAHCAHCGRSRYNVPLAVGWRRGGGPCG